MQRIDYRQVAPAAVAAMRDVQRYVDHCSLEKDLNWSSCAPLR